MGSPCDHAGKGSWRWALLTLRVVNSPSPQSKIGRHTVNIFSVASACSRHAFTKKASVLFCLLCLSSWILGCAVLLVGRSRALKPHSTRARACDNSFSGLPRCCPFFSAFWLRSSVVSVLISLISDSWSIGPAKINLMFLWA